MRGDATLSMRRNLMHYHFTSWPDFGVPKSPSGMLKFMRKIKHGSPTGYGAIVVHCRYENLTYLWNLCGFKARFIETKQRKPTKYTLTLWFT